MIYSDSEIKLLIQKLIAGSENEVVEFKEAKSNFSFKELGKYFSALSNEANTRDEKEAWLLFGVSNTPP